MENKLTWVELKKTVTRQTRLTEKEVNLILTTWLEEMVAALKRGEELHISGLGTFKMKTMKARKSVDVTTGEAIILPETDRLTYAMASSLEEQLREDTPAHLAVGVDPIKKLSEQADEIMDILGEMGQGNKKESKVENGKTKEGKKEERIKPERVVIPDYQIPQTENETVKKERLWLTALITIVVFVGLLFGLFFFFQHKLEKWLEDLRAEADMTEWVDTEKTANGESNEATENNIIETQEVVETPAEAKVTIKNYREYTDFITEENMHQDSRLAWMAYRFYGNKKLWVFIYDANKDHIKNPEHIAVGTLIRIPRLSQEILDFSEDVEQLVQEMSDEFLKK